MRQQAIVIGLGQFGMALARSLAEHHVEVIAVDRRQDRVQQAASFVSEAVRIDGADEAQIQRLAPERRDMAICAIGDDGREASILVTALLRQFGAPRVIARATDPLHERILYQVGAHEVINPQRDFGTRLAMRLSYRGIMDVLPLGHDLVVTEIRAPESFIGRSLSALGLRERFGTTVVAIQRVGDDGTERTILPDATSPIQRGDMLLLVSTTDAAHDLAERL